MLNYGRFHRYSENQKVIYYFCIKLKHCQTGIRLQARGPEHTGMGGSRVVPPERSRMVQSR